MIRSWLVHPFTRGLDIDAPCTTQLRRRIIREKSFLRQIYQEWYRSIATSLPPGSEAVLELGSGAGFLNEFIPDLITSDVFQCPGVSTVVDAHALPFDNCSLRGIVMIEVLHHLSRPRQFFAEATRCVKTGGVIVMIEPWVTPWSRLVYKHLHHEPFHPEAAEWEFPSTGPLSSANSALPWIVFERDRTQFEQEFPEWQIKTIALTMPFRYLVSGGASLRSLMPGWTFGLWQLLESTLNPWMDKLAMFAKIVLQKIK